MGTNVAPPAPVVPTWEKVASMFMVGLAAYDIQNASAGGPMIFITNPTLTSSLMQSVFGIWQAAQPSPVQSAGLAGSPANQQSPV